MLRGRPAEGDALRGAAYRAAAAAAALGEPCAPISSKLAELAEPGTSVVEMLSEYRQSADDVRVTLAPTVSAAGVAGALTIAWGIFHHAANDLAVGLGKHCYAPGRPGGSTVQHEGIFAVASRRSSPPAVARMAMASSSPKAAVAMSGIV